MTDERCAYCGRPLAECDCIRDSEGRYIAPAQPHINSVPADERFERERMRDPETKEEKKHELQGPVSRRVLAHCPTRRNCLPASDEHDRQEEALAEMGAV